MMGMNGKPRIVVIGGGIAGLVAAYRLQQRVPHADTVLLERDRYLGGKIRTERVDGFVIEAGADSFLSSKPAGIALCRELGLEDRLQGTNEATRRTFVLREGQLYPIPEGLSGLVPSRLEPLMESGLFSDEGKERLSRVPVIPPGEPGRDETLASFVERRFGREVYGRLVEPLMAGIYAGDGKKLSLEATFPQLRQLEQEHGSVVKGIQSARGASDGERAIEKRPAPFLTPRSGMADLAEAIERRLVRLLTGEASHVRSESGGYGVALAGGEVLHAAAVILATPACVTTRLLDTVDRDLAALLGGIRYVATATVSLAYHVRDIPLPLDGYGYIVPQEEGRPILACTWTSSKFAHRAPRGFALLRAFVGRDGMQEALGRTDEDLLRVVRDELHDVLGITARPVLHRTYRWPHAMPQYELGHLSLLAGIEDRLRQHPGLYLAGSAYRGVGIPDCIRSGEAAAQGAAEQIEAMIMKRRPN